MRESKFINNGDLQINCIIANKNKNEIPIIIIPGLTDSAQDMEKDIDNKLNRYYIMGLFSCFLGCIFVEKMHKLPVYISENDFEVYILPHLSHKIGHNRLKVSYHYLFNTILYVLKSGCS